MIDKVAFRSLSYGLYNISTKGEGCYAGCVVNTFQQVTSSPLQVSVALNKENATTALVEESGRFVATSFSQNATMELIGTFGFHSSNNRDKFANFETVYDSFGVPYVPMHAVSRFSVRVVQKIDLGTHVMFVGEVEESETLCADEPMTYAYYHLVKGGKTPPKASSFLGDEQPVNEGKSESAPKYAWRCSVCGHIEYADELPEDYVCPVCGVGEDFFELS